MKNYILNYYPNFKCVAGDCKHTCCAGWELQIDEQALVSYKKEQSSFKKELIRGIDFKKSKLKADKNGRCIFLNQNGLCEIIINLGEQSLCQVCRDHPRFRAFFNDRIEMGLGFCCEEATRIILTFQDKIGPVLLSDDKEQKEVDFNQKNIFEFRKTALNIVQDRNIDINQRIKNLLSLCNAQINYNDYVKVLKIFLSFERLDKSWTARLKKLKKTIFVKSVASNLTLYAEQFLVNSLFRHLYDAEDTFEVRARTIACVFGWWVINSIIANEQAEEAADLNLIVDVVRAYSAEVEYSQKNLDKFFSFANKFIKI